MPAVTFDWRDDPMGTVLAVPEVRARFIRTEPGQPRGTFHTHEESGGYEVWVVLEGEVRFEFDDGLGTITTVVATPGQSVVATPTERHRVSCAGDGPAVYYLTVTPHRSPTHTHYDEAGHRMPTVPGVTHPTWRHARAMGVAAD